MRDLTARATIQFFSVKLNASYKWFIIEIWVKTENQLLLEEQVYALYTYKPRHQNSIKMQNKILHLFSPCQKSVSSFTLL